MFEWWPELGHCQGKLKHLAWRDSSSVSSCAHRGTHLHPARLLSLLGLGAAILLSPGCWRQQQRLELLYLGLEAQAQHLVCLIQHAVLHMACRWGGGG